MGEIMDKHIKIFDRIYPYMISGMIFFIFGILHMNNCFQREIISLYISQALIWFPAVLGILLLALGNEFYVAVGEQIAFGVCVAGWLKCQWNLPLLLIFTIVLISMAGIALLFDHVYKACRIRFIWISIVFQFILAEIATTLKIYIRSTGRENGLTGRLEPLFLLLCIVIVYLYLNKTFS